MKTVILCGGKGTRLGSVGERTPKPLLPIGEHPILWHIMKIYEAQGFDDFVLCLGHLRERFEQWLDRLDGAWTVRPEDTGLDTPTGGRIKRIEQLVAGGDFFATYGDGVADVDLRALLEFHRAHGRAATITVVRPRLTFGIVHLGDGDRIAGFEEKPLMDEWVNGGFFVFSPRVFDYLADDSTLEREPFEALAAAGELMAFRHDGFWSCMDTYKDNLFLNECWRSGEARWKVW